MSTTLKRSHALDEDIRSIQSDINSLSSKLNTSHPSNGLGGDSVPPQHVKAEHSSKPKKKKSHVKDAKNSTVNTDFNSVGVEVKERSKQVVSEQSEVDDKTAILDLKRSLKDMEKAKERTVKQYESVLEEVVELKSKLTDYDQIVRECSQLRIERDRLKSNFDSMQRITSNQKDLISLLQQQLNDRNMERVRGGGGTLSMQEERSLQSNSITSHSVTPSVIARENKSW